MTEYASHPVVMAHPGHKRSEMIPIPGTERMVNGVPTPDYRGTAELLPPVTAIDADMEEYYRAQGYELAGKGDPAAYSMATTPHADPAYVPQEYPKWVNGVLIQSAEDDPSAAVVLDDMTVLATRALGAAQELSEAKTDVIVDQSAEIASLKAQLAAFTAAQQEPKETPSDRAKRAWETRRAKANA